MCKAPLFESLMRFSRDGSVRFHMPGHKGKPLPSLELFDASLIDYTELPKTGNLYLGDGPIAEAEELAAKYFRVPNCFFMTGGSTQGMMAALFLSCGDKGEVLIDRGCHRSAIAACAFLNLSPKYIYPDILPGFGVPYRIDPDKLYRAIAGSPDLNAVLITSPTYYGTISDIKTISEIVHSFGKLLIVDEAHGAHLPSLGQRSAVGMGADIAFSSAHKTMPALGQGAFFCSSEKFAPGDVRRALSLFGTSSPSYAVMASLDVARAHLEGEGKGKYLHVAQKCDELRDIINEKTAFRAISNANVPCIDRCRLVVNTACASLSGFDAAERLRRDFKVECEMADRSNVVFILTCCDDDEDISALSSALLSLSENRAYTEIKASVCNGSPHPEQAMPIRRAVFAKKENLALALCAGRVAGECVAPYPPGIPVVCPGELLDKNVIEHLIDQGYNKDTKISVVSL